MCGHLQGKEVTMLIYALFAIPKILCVVLFLLSFVLIALNHFSGAWYIYLMRFLIIFSSIIPLRYDQGDGYGHHRLIHKLHHRDSLRVNLDLAKTFYSYLMMNDDKIPNTIVRTSTIPEELGRIEYLLSDKTGTLTQNGKAWKGWRGKKAQC